MPVTELICKKGILKIPFGGKVFITIYCQQIQLLFHVVSADRSNRLRALRYNLVKPNVQSIVKTSFDETKVVLLLI